MFIQDKKSMLRREHQHRDLIDCLVEELFAQRNRLASFQDKLNDVNNRLRYLEYMSKPRREH